MHIPGKRHTAPDSFLLSSMEQSSTRQWLGLASTYPGAFEVWTMPGHGAKRVKKQRYQLRAGLRELVNQKDLWFSEPSLVSISNLILQSDTGRPDHQGCGGDTKGREDDSEGNRLPCRPYRLGLSPRVSINVQRELTPHKPWPVHTSHKMFKLLNSVWQNPSNLRKKGAKKNLYIYISDFLFWML